MRAQARTVIKPPGRGLGRQTLRAELLYLSFVIRRSCCSRGIRTRRRCTRTALKSPGRHGLNRSRGNQDESQGFEAPVL